MIVWFCMMQGFFFCVIYMLRRCSHNIQLLLNTKKI